MQQLKACFVNNGMYIAWSKSYKVDTCIYNIETKAMIINVSRLFVCFYKVQIKEVT